ncbi:DUS1L [Symbiodinium natans]|uniref:tRNA-dihydrouridine synthase n=1 Tax=Symbiodinium natans TaxID=878477 RepID=A0A812HUK0_9DINO|nr:DUS1L [Symbiodinium natans]
MVNGSELPFRLLVRRLNAGAVRLCYSPMLYCSKVLQDASDGMLRQHFLIESDEDRPLIVQLASNSPEELAAAAKTVAPFCDGVCLNLGCPQWFAERCQLGAFLLEKPGLCAELVRALAMAVGQEKAVCCKILLLDGETSKERQVRTVALARLLADAGCTLLAVHGRTRAQKNDGPVDYAAIREVQAAVDIPVLVNGGIASRSHADSVLQQTGCAAAMIATAFLANPSLLCSDAATGGSPAIACEQAHSYVDLCHELEGPDQPWAQLPLHLGHLLKRHLREKEATSTTKRTGRYEFLKRLSKGDPPDGFSPCGLEEAALLLRNFAPRAVS